MSKRSVLATLLRTAADILLSGEDERGSQKRRAAAEKRSSPVSRSRREAALQRFDADEATRRYLMKVMLPLTVIPGVLDWLWHKQTKIETTSGTKESLFHLAMMGQNCALLLSGLFLEMNAGGLALMSGLAVAHEATAMWDVSSTISERKISAHEQHTHSFMESIPFLITACAVCFHPNQFLALFGAGPEKAEMKLKLKRPLLPVKDIALIFGSLSLVGGLPLVEELLRCMDAQAKGLVGTDTPSCARELYGDGD
jgi:hypothetical protein